MSIEEKALLVQLSFGSYTGKRRDGRMSAQLATEHGASADAIETVLRLVPAAALRDVEAQTRAVRKLYERYTLPWQRRGAALLPSEVYMEFQAQLGDALRRREAAIKAFVEEYKLHSNEWSNRLNGLGGDIVMPSAETVEGAFRAELDYWPIPTGKDFRVSLNDAEVTRLREQADAAAEERVGAAVRDAVNRLRSVIDRYVIHLRAKNEGKRTRITSSLPDDLRDIISILPAFNLNNDPELARIAEECKGLLSVSIDDIRSDEVTRRTAQAEAERIANSMRNIWG